MTAVRLAIHAITALAILIGSTPIAQAKPPSDAAGLAIQKQMERHPPSAGIASAGELNYANCLDAPGADGSLYDCAAFKRKGLKSDSHKPSTVKAKSAAPSLNYFGEGCEKGCALPN